MSNELIGGLDAQFGLISVSDGVPVLTGSTLSDWISSPTGAKHANEFIGHSVIFAVS